MFVVGRRDTGMRYTTPDGAVFFEFTKGYGDKVFACGDRSVYGGHPVLVILITDT